MIFALSICGLTGHINPAHVSPSVTPALLLALQAAAGLEVRAEQLTMDCLQVTDVFVAYIVIDFFWCAPLLSWSALARATC